MDPKQSFLSKLWDGPNYDGAGLRMLAAGLVFVGFVGAVAAAAGGLTLYALSFQAVRNAIAGIVTLVTFLGTAAWAGKVFDRRLRHWTRSGKPESKAPSSPRGRQP